MSTVFDGLFLAIIWSGASFMLGLIVGSRIGDARNLVKRQDAIIQEQSALLHRFELLADEQNAMLRKAVH